MHAVGCIGVFWLFPNCLICLWHFSCPPCTYECVYPFRCQRIQRIFSCWYATKYFFFVVVARFCLLVYLFNLSGECKFCFVFEWVGSHDWSNDVDVNGTHCLGYCSTGRPTCHPKRWLISAHIDDAMSYMLHRTGLEFTWIRCHHRCLPVCHSEYRHESSLWAAGSWWRFFFEYFFGKHCLHFINTYCLSSWRFRVMSNVMIDYWFICHAAIWIQWCGLWAYCKYKWKFDFSRQNYQYEKAMHQPEIWMRTIFLILMKIIQSILSTCADVRHTNNAIHRQVGKVCYTYDIQTYAKLISYVRYNTTICSVVRVRGNCNELPFCSKTIRIFEYSLDFFSVDVLPCL